MSHYALSGRVDELTDGTGGSVEAAMGAAIGPYWKSRLRVEQGDPWRPKQELKLTNREGQRPEGTRDTAIRKVADLIFGFRIESD
jgi:hypothetical protein